jgi:hypothetical protein
MAWNCLDNEERLSDYLDGLLPADERSAFESHAEGCAKCGQLVAGVRGLVGGMRRMEMVEAPQGLIYRILAETTGKEAKPARKPGFSWFPAFLQPKLALGALSVIATFGILIQATGLNYKTISRADLNPLNVFRATNRQVHLTYARGMKFVNDLRVVYEIQSRLQGAPAAPAPVPERRDQTSPPSTPESERQLKNHYDQSQAATMAAGLLCSLPAATSALGTNLGAIR